MVFAVVVAVVVVIVVAVVVVIVVVVVVVVVVVIIVVAVVVVAVVTIWATEALWRLDLFSWPSLGSCSSFSVLSKLRTRFESVGMCICVRVKV